LNEQEQQKLLILLDELRSRVDILEAMQANDDEAMHPRLFLAKGTADDWAEQDINSSDALADVAQGRICTAAGNASLIEDAEAFLVVQHEVEGGMRYVKVSGGSGMFPVLVVWSAGSDGDATNYATWTYNIYALTDTGHATALTAAAVQPENSPARIVKGPVTKATTDTVGLAYYAADGTTVHLYTCAEKHGSCT
jgi:hypothetical protein